MDYEKFEGKKVLYFDHDLKAGSQIVSAIVAGCDPDLGICIQTVDGSRTLMVIGGPSSPSWNGYFPERFREDYNRAMPAMLTQIKSGCVSMFKFEKDLGLLTDTTNPPQCQFSM